MHCSLGAARQQGGAAECGRARIQAGRRLRSGRELAVGSARSPGANARGARGTKRWVARLRQPNRSSPGRATIVRVWPAPQLQGGALLRKSFFAALCALQNVQPREKLTLRLHRSFAASTAKRFSSLIKVSSACGTRKPRHVDLSPCRKLMKPRCELNRSVRPTL